MKDNRRPGNDLVLDSAAQNADKLAKVRTSIKRSAQAFLDKMKGNPHGGPLAKKVPRIKACEWLLGTHRMISTYIADEGWKFFQLTQHKLDAIPPWEWPRIDLAADQGSDIISACFWLTMMGVIFTLFGDPSHGVWNDTKNMLRKCGLWSHTMLVMVLYQLHLKPYQSGEYFQRLLESSRDYFAVHNGPDSCELFSGSWGEICQDRGIIASGANDEEYKDAVWDELKDAKQVFAKGPKITSSRWFGFIDEGAKLMPDWTVKRLLLTVLCVGDGLITNNYFPMVAEMFKKIRRELAGADEAPDGNLPVAEGMQVVEKQKTATQNACVLSLALTSDYDSKRRELQIHTATAPVRLWHGNQSVVNRSPKEMGDWLDAQLRGAGLQPLVETIDLMRTRAALETCGFKFYLPAECFATGGGGVVHPLVQAERDYAALLGRMILEFVGQRMRRQAPFWWGWPGRGHGLSSTAKQLRETTKNALFDDHDDYLDMVARTSSKRWLAIQNRSCFKHAAVVQLIALMEVSNWEPDEHEKVEHFFRSRRNTCVVTKPIEDGIGQVRAQETVGRNNVVSPCRQFYTLVQKRTLDSNHRYAAPPMWRTIPLAKGHQFPHELNHIKAHEFIKKGLPYKNIIKGGQTPPWYTTTGSNLSEVVGDLFLTRHCRRFGYECAETSIVASFLVQPDVLIKNAAQGDVWLFPLQQLGQAIVCLRATNEGLPTTNEHLTERWFPFLPDDDFSHVLIVCAHSFHDWSAQPIKWTAPAELVNDGMDPNACLIHAVEDGLAEPFLCVAARQAFWELKKTDLLKIAELEMFAIGDTNATKFDILMQLVRRFLGTEFTDEELHKIMCKRLNRMQVDRHGLEHIEEALEVLDPQDQKENTKFLHKELEAEEEDPRVLEPAPHALPQDLPEQLCHLPQERSQRAAAQDALPDGDPASLQELHWFAVA